MTRTILLLIILLLGCSNPKQVATTNDIQDLWSTGVEIPPCEAIFSIKSPCGEVRIFTNGTVELTGCWTNTNEQGSNFWVAIAQAYPGICDQIKATKP